MSDGMRLTNGQLWRIACVGQGW